MNDGRKNLLKLIRDIAKSPPDYIICTFKDRVARFATKLLEEFCQIYDVKLIETEFCVEVTHQQTDDPNSSNQTTDSTSFTGSQPPEDGAEGFLPLSTSLFIFSLAFITLVRRRKQ